jgi:hypothetical protein
MGLTLLSITEISPCAMTTDEASNTDGSGSENTLEVRSLSEARAGDVIVREYVADGALYAYRDGDEHVVVSRGCEPSTKWVKRRPAERETVELGETLWTVPDNWEQLMAVQPYHNLAFCIFRIPETGVDVTISIPLESSVADADYNVEAVGEVTAQYADECGWEQLNEIINDGRSRDRLNPDVIRELEGIAANTDRMEAEIKTRINQRVLETIQDSQSVQISESWIVSPENIGCHVDHEKVLRNVLADHDVPESIRTKASEILIEENVVPVRPKVHIGVEKM